MVTFHLGDTIRLITSDLHPTYLGYSLYLLSVTRQHNINENAHFPNQGNTGLAPGLGDGVTISNFRHKIASRMRNRTIRKKKILSIVQKYSIGRIVRQ